MVGRFFGNYSRHQKEPVAETCEQSQTVGSDTKRVGGLGIQSNLLEEVSTGIGKAKTADELAPEHNHGNLYHLSVSIEKHCCEGWNVTSVRRLSKPLKQSQ